MLALSIAATALSDLTNVGQPAAAPNAADGFLALLNTGSGNGNDIWSGNGEAANNDGNSNDQAAASNPVATPVSVPTSIFAANNPQNTHAPAPQPQQPSQETAPSSANNNTQNAPSPLSPAPKAPTPPSNTGSQNTTSTASGQSSDQATNGNVNQTAKQLRTQIQDELGNISQILLSMIQALSVGNAQPIQPVTTTADTTATPLPQVAAAGNDATGSAANGQLTGTGSQTDQEIALLKDMQSLLQQLQQSLPGQGQDQNSQDNVQTLSDSLLSDMTKLSQLVGQAPTGSDSSTANSLLGTTQFEDLSALLKTSVTQAKSQLQNLQTTNEAILAQAKADFQAAPVAMGDQAKTTQNNNSANSASTNSVPATGNTLAAPVTPDVTIKPVLDNLQFNAAALVQDNISQDGGDSAGNSNQDSGQNQTAQPVITASSSPSSTSATDGASFARILNQVSQSGVLDQVQFQVKTALSDGSSKITIQLNPPELGKLNVQFTASTDGKASNVTIVADNQNTLNLLKQDPQGLTRALNDAGLTTDSGSLNFSLSGGQQNQTQGSQQAATTYQQAQPEEDNPAINAISRSYVVNLAEGLDITI